MSHRAGQVDMSEVLTTNLARNNLDAAFLADDATMLHALVLAAVTLVILGRAKNLGAKETVTFRLKSTIVDRFRFFNFTERTLRTLSGEVMESRMALKFNGSLGRSNKLCISSKVHPPCRMKGWFL